MKTMTCKQLGGACDEEFHAATFDDMAGLSRQHGMDMAKKGDMAHLAAMEEMKKFMTDPVAMNKWMQEREAEFEAISED